MENEALFAAETLQNVATNIPDCIHCKEFQDNSSEDARCAVSAALAAETSTGSAP